MMDDKKPGITRAEKGDHVFFTHEGQPHSAPVVCHGKHGVTVRHKGKHVTVPWGGLLGHHTRAERKYAVIDEGEDGAIIQDEDGTRRFMRGQIEKPDTRSDEYSDDDLAKVRGHANEEPVAKCCGHDHEEQLAKADPGGPSDPLEPHHSPFVRRLVELFTERGLQRAEKMAASLWEWLSGKKGNGTAQPKPDRLMDRWSPQQLDMVRRYLEATDTDEFKVDDWMLCVDYLAQRYFPADDMTTESQWLAQRAVMMGKVQARMADLSLDQADTLLRAAPSAATLNLNQQQAAIIEYGSTRCAESVTSVVGRAKQALKQTIIAHKQREIMGDPEASASALQTKLFDQFATLNSDWRRIAVTETGEMENQGFIASIPPGDHVRRMEQYANACPFCRSIDQKVMKVVPANAPDKDGDAEVWPGKTNVGRSSSPRKIGADGTLVDRTPSEMWWPAAGTQHPHCRGTWISEDPPPSSGDEDFTKWMRETLAAVDKPEPPR